MNVESKWIERAAKLAAAAASKMNLSGSAAGLCVVRVADKTLSLSASGLDWCVACSTVTPDGADDSPMQCAVPAAELARAVAGRQRCAIAVEGTSLVVRTDVAVHKIGVSDAGTLADPAVHFPGKSEPVDGKLLADAFNSTQCEPREGITIVSADGELIFLLLTGSRASLWSAKVPLTLKFTIGLLAACRDIVGFLNAAMPIEVGADNAFLWLRQPGTTIGLRQAEVVRDKRLNAVREFAKHTDCAVLTNIHPEPLIERLLVTSSVAAAGDGARRVRFAAESGSLTLSSSRDGQSCESQLPIESAGQWSREYDPEPVLRFLKLHHSEPISLAMGLEKAAGAMRLVSADGSHVYIQTPIGDK